jgi:hypothetical protein
MTRQEVLFVYGIKEENGMRCSVSHQALISGSSPTVFAHPPVGTARRLGHVGVLPSEGLRLKLNCPRKRDPRRVRDSQESHLPRKCLCPSVLPSLSPAKPTGYPFYHDVP